MKVLIVCLPNGMLVYASKPYEGSISDRQIIIDSGFLEMLDEGDVVLGNIFIIIIAFILGSEKVWFSVNMLQIVL